MRILGKYSIFILLSLLAVVFILLAIFSTGTHGGADDYVHYSIARYAFKYPALFLDHWGKPIFTLLSSPFAQFGFTGMKIFNIIVGSFTAYLLYLLLKIRNYKLAIIAPVFLFFAPIYTVLLLSGMTEIFFSFLLVLAIYLFFREKYIFAAIVVSFLPIARTEAFILIPFFIIAFSWRKKWTSLPFLLTAFCLYGLVGWIFVYHDFFWLIHQNPYKYKVPLYGSGELLHFVKNLKNITGLPLLILSIPGFAIAFYNLFKKGIKLQNPESEEILLIMIPLATYFAAHSYIWWKGIGASIGLIRVMTCIIPLWMFYSVKGLEFISGYLNKYKFAKYLLAAAALYFVVITPFKVYVIPVKRLASHEVTKKAADWILSNKLTRYTVFYYEPYVTTALEIDPYNQKASHALVFDNQVPSKGLPDSAVLVWDAQFGPNEGGLPLDNIMKDPQMQLLKIFRPAVPFTVLGGFTYEIYIFQKISESHFHNNYDIAKSTAEEDIPGFERKILFYNGFEKPSDRKELKPDSLVSHSGKFSVFLDTINEYSLTFQADCSEFSKVKSGSIRIIIYCLTGKETDKTSLTLVSSIENNGKIYEYHVQKLSDLSAVSGKWTRAVLQFPIPELKSPKDIFKVYLWQHGKPLIRLDDYTIELLILQ